jgi:hypothetical protein
MKDSGLPAIQSKFCGLLMLLDESVIAKLFAPIACSDDAPGVARRRRQSYHLVSVRTMRSHANDRERAMTTARQQDIAREIQQATVDCERARDAYRRGEGVDRYNKCNSRLAELQQEMWRVPAGIATNYDRPPGR